MLMMICTPFWLSTPPLASPLLETQQLTKHYRDASKQTSISNKERTTAKRVELRIQGKQKYKNYNTQTHTTDGSQRLQSKERDWSWSPKESSSLDSGGVTNTTSPLSPVCAMIELSSVLSLRVPLS
jgi:cell division protein FtsN